MIQRLSLLVLLASVSSVYNHPACTQSVKAQLPFLCRAHMGFNLEACGFCMRCAGTGDRQNLVSSTRLFSCLICQVKILPFTSLHLLFCLEERILFSFLCILYHHLFLNSIGTGFVYVLALLVVDTKLV